MQQTPSPIQQRLAPVRKAVLTVQDLRTQIWSAAGPATVVDGVSFDLFEGEILGLVGESGSGKTITGLSVLGLLPANAHVVGGSVLFDGQDLLQRSSAEMSRIRGRKLAMIPQDPMTALDPVFDIADQMTEAPQVEDGLRRSSALERATSLLSRFRIADPASTLRGYPHQLSGGMRQRVAGAIAVSRGPSVLIADEPTTSLDATLQLEYLRLLKSIQSETNLSVLFITHDFGIIERLCDRVAVMYAGKIVETSSVDRLWQSPAHPYTEALLAAVPSLEHNPERLPTMPGGPPQPNSLPIGCSFAPRCPYAFEPCEAAYPPEFHVGDQHMARCWRHAGDA